jgi:HAD superfamily hydrolase (TIGR01509 family)
VTTLRAVVFDWDGTLLDSAEASYRCYARLFAAYDIPFDRAAFARTYSPDWYRTYALLGLPAERWEEANTRWLELYAEEPPGLLPGARAALDRLNAAGLPLGLVTSGQRERVVSDLARVGLATTFAMIVSSSDLPERKPHPEPLRRALRAMQIAASDAVYIGDSPEDVRMAQAADVRAVAVPGGFPNRAELTAAGADVFAESLREALDALGIP